MLDQRDEQTRIWLNPDRLPYHRRQFHTPYRSTVHLAAFLQSVVRPLGGEALDVACGAGANIAYLEQAVPGYRWTGIDLAGDVLFPVARDELGERAGRIELLQGDLYDLGAALGDRRFDLVLSLQTLMGLPAYEEALDQLFAVTRGWLVVNSLFTDFDVDTRTQVMDYARPADCQGPFFYNIYSIRRFRDECLARGAREVVVHDFEIDVDLPPTFAGMQTYTMALADSRRLQCSGPLMMPWKFVAVRVGAS